MNYLYVSLARPRLGKEKLFFLPSFTRNEGVSSSSWCLEKAVFFIVAIPEPPYYY